LQSNSFCEENKVFGWSWLKGVYLPTYVVRVSDEINIWRPSSQIILCFDQPKVRKNSKRWMLDVDRRARRWAWGRSWTWTSRCRSRDVWTSDDATATRLRFNTNLPEWQLRRQSIWKTMGTSFTRLGLGNETRKNLLTLSSIKKVKNNVIRLTDEIYEVSSKTQFLIAHCNQNVFKIQRWPLIACKFIVITP
jgi:hypothetical protein